MTQTPVRVYVSIPNRYRHELPKLRDTVAKLFGDEEVFCPSYSGGWCFTGPKNIMSSAWFLVAVPDDGIVGRGVFSEVELALEHFREVTVLFRGRPYNVVEQPFDVIDQEDWTHYARLKNLQEDRG